MTSVTSQTAPLIALGFYPISEPAILRRIDSSFINDNWLVADGVTGARYVLRRYLRIPNVERMAFQLSFQEHLYASSFPTAPVVRTNDGDLFAAIDGSCWALCGFIDGLIYDFASLPQAREAGKRLAQFEAVAADYGGPVVEPPVDDVATWPGSVSSRIRLSSMLSDDHEERLRERYSGPEYADDLAFFSTWRRNAARAWPVDCLSALPDGWLHGDYHGRNMVFQGDAFAGLFDFDSVARGPRGYEVGRAVYNFGREHRDSTNLRPEFCRAFLEGFEREQPLADEERRSLAYMTVLNWVPDTPFDAARHQDKDAGARFSFVMRMMRAVHAELHRLAPEFGWDAI